MSPLMKSLSLLNIKPISNLSFRYCNIHFTTYQWTFPGLAMYLLPMLITCEISARMQTITYMEPLIALSCGTQVLYSLPSFILADRHTKCSKWEATRVLTVLGSYILILSKTFSRYSFFLKFEVPNFLFLRISKSRIFLVAPKSFISNSLLSWDFNLVIFETLLVAIIMSST